MTTPTKRPSRVTKTCAHLMQARRGEDVELQPRKISIQSFEITQINLPEVHFKVVCSTGTYIRSLANDYGAELGCGAYLGSLCRTRIGEFKMEDAMTIEDIEAQVKMA